MSQIKRATTTTMNHHHHKRCSSIGSSSSSYDVYASSIPLEDESMMSSSTTTRTSSYEYACDELLGDPEASLIWDTRTSTRKLEKTVGSRNSPCRRRVVNDDETGSVASSSSFFTANTQKSSLYSKRSSKRSKRSKQKKQMASLSAGSMATLGYMILQYLMDPNGYSAHMNAATTTPMFGTAAAGLESNPMGLLGLTQFVGLFIMLLKIKLVCSEQQQQQQVDNNNNNNNNKKRSTVRKQSTNHELSSMEEIPDLDLVNTTTTTTTTTTTLEDSFQSTASTGSLFETLKRQRDEKQSSFRSLIANHTTKSSAVQMSYKRIANMIENNPNSSISILLNTIVEDFTKKYLNGELVQINELVNEEKEYDDNDDDDDPSDDNSEDSYEDDDDDDDSNSCATTTSSVISLTE